ncbi:tRNA-modifying protein YgfZ [Thorsellia kenyensis]|uniref:tRNA-modifying protein YgfZ n=1 Tax=Thorsellia kenyensis TaxID=1549888 RepID=A0ABV6CCD4_9GAMM
MLELQQQYKKQNIYFFTLKGFVMIKSLSISKLNQYTLIKVSGIEAQKYLQGQVTQDLYKMQTQTLYYAAHCEPKGKVIALLMIWKQNDDTFFYILPKSLEESQLKEIKKYAIFSKVSFEIQPETSFHFLHLDNVSLSDKERIQALLANFSTSIETQKEYNSTNTLLNNGKFHFSLGDNNDFIIINFSDDDNFFAELSKLNYTISTCDSSLFEKTQIERGIPQLSLVTSQEFLPQALNIQALNAISFSKGCYTGQEMVARAKYRGANKRALYYLKGTSSVSPEIGSNLLMKLGENYKETGNIISFVKEKNEIFIQVVLSNRLEENSEFKIIGCDDSQLFIQKLPYDLE